MIDTTLIFLVKREEGKIAEILLAMKKRRFGTGKWNGVGGKLDPGETIEESARRETKEEIEVEIGELNKIAEIKFRFPDKPEWDQLTHIYFVEDWKGEPVETEEMRPEWYKISDIPFDSMWPDDKFWLPLVLEGKLVKAEFDFGEGDTILRQEVKTVESLGK